MKKQRKKWQKDYCITKISWKLWIWFHCLLSSLQNEWRVTWKEEVNAFWRTDRSTPRALNCWIHEWTISGVNTRSSWRIWWRSLYSFNPSKTIENSPFNGSFFKYSEIYIRWFSIWVLGWFQWFEWTRSVWWVLYKYKSCGQVRRQQTLEESCQFDEMIHTKCMCRGFSGFQVTYTQDRFDCLHIPSVFPTALDKSIEIEGCCIKPTANQGGDPSICSRDRRYTDILSKRITK